jgi:hypothetical protein
VKVDDQVLKVRRGRFRCREVNRLSQLNNLGRVVEK